MNAIDETFLLFNKAYRTKRFAVAGNVIIDIISALPFSKGLETDSWRYDVERLLQVLHGTGYIFDSPDAFYDMVATIAFQLRIDPSTDWRVLLN